MAAITRLDTSVRYSEAVVSGGVVYLAGQVPADGGADMAAQTRSVLAQIDALLARAGSHKSRILSATIYLTSIADKDAMNAEWEAWVPAGCAPARATVGGVALVDASWKIEVCVVAAVGAPA